MNLFSNLILLALVLHNVIPITVPTLFNWEGSAQCKFMLGIQTSSINVIQTQPVLNEKQDKTFDVNMRWFLLFSITHPKIRTFRKTI